MKTYQAPEVVEIGTADEEILGAKGIDLWDETDQTFTMSALSVVDVDE